MTEDRNSDDSVAALRSEAATRLHLAGVALFGDRYQGPFSRELDISRPLLHAMLNGKRRISREFEARLAEEIRSRIIPELEGKAVRLEAIAEAIEKKLSVCPS